MISPSHYAAAFEQRFANVAAVTLPAQPGFQARPTPGPEHGHDAKAAILAAQPEPAIALRQLGPRSVRPSHQYSAALELHHHTAGATT